MNLIPRQYLIRKPFYSKFDAILSTSTCVGTVSNYSQSLLLLKKKTHWPLVRKRTILNWATATCRRNLVPTFVDGGVSRGQRGGSPTVVNLSFLDRSRYFYTPSEQWYINKNIILLNIINCLACHLRHSVSETGFCPHLQVETIQLDPTDRVIICLRFPVI
jgi:hypothetical protein